MVVAGVALFVALGGITYAITLPRNSVGPKQLKRNAVTTKKVKNRSLLGADLKPRQIAAASYASEPEPPGGNPPLPTPPAGYAEVLGLGDGRSAGLLRTPVRARVVATASIGVVGETDTSLIGCKLQLGRDGGVFSDISQPGFAEPAANGFVQLPLTGAADVAPGRYEVRTVCRGFDGVYVRGDLTVVAVRR
jgi:hypothetical protein